MCWGIVLEPTDIPHVLLTTEIGEHGYVSGPIHSCGRTVGCVRMGSVCTPGSHQSTLPTVSPTSLFWECRQLFRIDGRYPNWLGAKLLSSNIYNCIAHLCAPCLDSQDISLMAPPLDQSLHYLCPQGPSTSQLVPQQLVSDL